MRTVVGNIARAGGVAHWMTLTITILAAPGFASEPKLGTQPATLGTGLVLTFAQNRGGWIRTDTRRSRLAALHVPAGTPPTPFLPVGPFVARFEGFLDAGPQRTVRLHARGRGHLDVQVNGQDVLRAAGPDLTRVSSDPMHLNEGLNRLAVRYQSPANGSATLRLAWSSDTFSLEPLPPDRLLHDAQHAELRIGRARRQGRELFVTRGCIQCHGPVITAVDAESSMPEANDAAPSLVGVARRLDPAWIARWILDPQSLRPDATMPRVLPAADPGSQLRQAADIAAFLTTLTGDASTVSAAPVDGASVDRGELLFENLGCIGCHSFKAQGEADEWKRVSLHYVSAKYRPAALYAYLLAPHRHHTSSRMPDFKLGEHEAAAIEAYLRAAATGVVAPLSETASADPQRGRSLFSETGCINCHALPGTPPLPRPRWVGVVPDRHRGWHLQHRPAFSLSSDDVRAIEAFLDTDRRSLGRRVAAEFAERRIHALRCTVCHGFDDLGPALPLILAEDGSQGHAPPRLPSLTWIGEKLRVSWAERVLNDTLNERPRPWLAMRMPAIAGQARLLALGFSAQHGFGVDRASVPPFDRALADVGRRLIGKNGGFNCIQCHAVADRAAEDATETPGLNLSTVPARLHYAYFSRWMRDPARIDPAARMPKPAVDDLGESLRSGVRGRADRTHLAIWQHLQSLGE